MMNPISNWWVPSTQTALRRERKVVQLQSLAVREISKKTATLIISHRHTRYRLVCKSSKRAKAVLCRIRHRSAEGKLQPILFCRLTRQRNQAISTCPQDLLLIRKKATVELLRRCKSRNRMGCWATKSPILETKKTRVRRSTHAKDTS